MTTHVGGWRGLPQEIRRGLIIVLAIIVGGVAAMAIWQGLQAVGSTSRRAASDGAQKLGQKYAAVKEDWSEASGKRYLEKTIRGYYPDVEFKGMRAISDDEAKVHPWLTDEVWSHTGVTHHFFIVDLRLKDGLQVGTLEVVWRSPGSSQWQTSFKKLDFGLPAGE